MTTFPLERKIRTGLVFIRFLNAYLPLPITRWLLNQSLPRVRLDAAVTRAAVSAQGVACEWLTPRDGRADQVLMYLHGGGFVYGLTPQHLQLGASLAQKTGMRVLMVDYRLAPEYPFPAALDDCVAVYRWLLGQGIVARKIAVAGDSAGGNLTITTLMKLRDSGDPLPAAGVCLSPVADLSDRAEPEPARKDPLLHPRAVRFYNRAYVADNDPHNPLISPVFGRWHALPPLLVHAGEDEMLRPDAVRIEALAKAAGVEVRLEIYPRMWHVWQIFPELPQTAQSLDDIAGFIRTHIGLAVLKT